MAPIGEAVANAIEEGYSLETKGGFHGYYFKILKGQSPDGPMRKIDYVIEGVMIGGFALVAVPAEYRVTRSRSDPRHAMDIARCGSGILNLVLTGRYVTTGRLTWHKF